FSVAVHLPVKAPALLNGFRLWVAMMIALTVVNYGFPIVQLASLSGTSVPAIPMGGR
ncbi:MAG: cytochrome C oxidase subunit I, partial [Caldimonas sp.]